MERTLSLRRMTALAIIVGLLLPILFSGWQTYRQQREVLTTSLESDQQRLVGLLAKSLAGLMWNMDYKSARLLEEASALDERVVRISVHGESGELPQLYLPARQHGELSSSKAPIIWQKNHIGDVQVDMDTGQLDERLRAQFQQFVLIAVAQIALSLTLILFILNARFVAPVKRLMIESAMLARRKLDKPFVWRRRDELGKLGTSLESTRIALKTAFDELEQSEQRFRSLTKLSSDWYWERDADDKLTVLSSGFQETTGIDPNGLIGASRSETGNFSYSEKSWENYVKKIAAREAFRDLEWSVARKDGEMRYGVTSGEPVFSDNGEFRGYRGIGRDITASKIGEAARKSEVRLRTMVQHLPAGAVYIDSGALLLNEAAQELTGYASHEIVTVESWFIIIFGDEALLKKAIYEQDRARGFPKPREIEIRRKDGSYRTIEFAGYLDQGSEVWILHDVTLRKAAQDALEQSLIEQRAILDNALVGIYFQKDRLIQRCNLGLEEILGYGHSELIGRPVSLMFENIDSFDRFSKAGGTMIAEGKSWVGEWEAVRKDGSKIWVLFHGKAIDPDAAAWGSIWVMQDITERRQTENALKLTLLEQQAIFDNTIGGVEFVKNRIIQRCNNGLETMLGYGPGELIGKPTRIYFTDDASWLAHGEEAYPLLRAGKSASGEFELLRKDGKRIWCMYHAKPIDPHDLSKGSIWVTQDITERKRTEAALIQAKVKLEHSLLHEQHTYRDIALQTEMSGFLQACESPREAYECIASFMPRLFPASAGKIYLMDDSVGELVAQSGWGEMQSLAASFLPAECWAMRRGQPYVVHDPLHQICCPHLENKKEVPREYACLPLAAQGDIYGLLLIEYHALHENNDQVNLRQRRAIGIAEQIGLALANLHLREKLRAQSIRDPLTGLYNRRHMDLILRRELSRAKRNDGNLTVTIVDVDHFKKFNDTYGHDAGDLVLKAVAKALEQRVRDVDLVCRFGGEEFVIVLPEISRDMAIKRMEMLLVAIRELDVKQAGRSLGSITASFGVAIYPDQGIDAESLLKSADDALYEAKETGRNRIVIRNEKLVLE
jgi:diguanylate cyclase (GGDEF)-like protein/PAS domain S-box-containing protein